MKKRTVFTALALLLCVVLFCCVPSGVVLFSMDGQYPVPENTQSGSAAEVRMPSLLRTIGDEAFLGTAMETVYLGRNVREIGRRAFADAANLTAIYIPEATTAIGSGAFDGTDGLQVYGISGSYAQAWAAANGYAFIHKDIWVKADLRGLAFAISFILIFCLALPGRSPRRDMNAATARKTGEGRSMRRRERPELHAQDGYFP